MTRERETNIIMHCQSLLKMGLMTGRASCTHTWPDSQCGHLCACSIMSVWVCKIKSDAYLHPHDITDSEITHRPENIKSTRQGELSMTSLLMHNIHEKVPFIILRGDSFCQLFLIELITFLIVSFFQFINTFCQKSKLAHLCFLYSSLSLVYWTHVKTQTLPTVQPKGKASQYLQNQGSVRR